MLKVPTKNVIEDTEYDFFHKTTAFIHTMYFSRIWRNGIRWNGFQQNGFRRNGTEPCQLIRSVDWIPLANCG